MLSDQPENIEVMRQTCVKVGISPPCNNTATSFVESKSDKPKNSVFNFGCIVKKEIDLILLVSVIGQLSFFVYCHWIYPLPKVSKYQQNFHNFRHWRKVIIVPFIFFMRFLIKKLPIRSTNKIYSLLGFVSLVEEDWMAKLKKTFQSDIKEPFHSTKT